MATEGSVPAYETRYVAFIDILGFSDLVTRANTDETLLQRLVVSLQGMRDFQKLGPAMNMSAAADPSRFFQEMFCMSTFSDCVVMSTKCNAIGLGIITTLPAIMCAQLLSHGIFTRGAICRGKLIHTSDVVLGQGLIDAYHLESRAAVFPRILLANDVGADLSQLAPDDMILGLKRRDSDGLHHLHFLHNKITQLCAGLSSASGPGQFMEVGRLEIIRLLHDQTDPSIRSKLGWLANYFNASAVDNALAPLSLNQ